LIVLPERLEIERGEEDARLCADGWEPSGLRVITKKPPV